jgi:hypothetical protein
MLPSWDRYGNCRRVISPGFVLRRQVHVMDLFETEEVRSRLKSAGGFCGAACFNAIGLTTGLRLDVDTSVVLQECEGPSDQKCVFALCLPIAYTRWYR